MSSCFFFFSIGYNTIIYWALFCDEFNHIIRVCSQTDTLAISLPVNREQARRESPRRLTNDCGMIWRAGAPNKLSLSATSPAERSKSQLTASESGNWFPVLPLSPSLSLTLSLSLNSFLCISVPGTRLSFLPVLTFARPYGVASPR